MGPNLGPLDGQDLGGASRVRSVGAGGSASFSAELLRSGHTFVLKAWEKRRGLVISIQQFGQELYFASGTKIYFEGVVSMDGVRRISEFRMGLICVMAAAALGGCAASNSGSGPTAASLPAGETCGSIKSQLNRLDAKGVQAYVQAQGEGKKLSGAQKTDADNYNRLLNEYLGARCHV